MHIEIREWLPHAGIPVDVQITPMAPGLGHTALWRISDTGRDGDLVLRMFPRGDTISAHREALAMRTAHDHGLPVPDIIETGVIEERPVLLTAFAPGETVAKVLERAPDRATALGRQLGITLGKLHRIVAPTDLAPAERWLERGGPALEPLHPQLRALPMTDRLLHLDYHPNNVMMLDDDVSGIIDWTNTLPGPPHMDLARSRAIMQAARAGGLFPPTYEHVLDQLEEGLVAGHMGVIGPDPHPALSAAWAMAMTVDDLAGHLGKPGSWVTEPILEQLRDERDRLIAAAMGHTEFG